MASGTIRMNSVLLWENSNPSSGFSAQTVSSLADLSVFREIVVMYKYTTGTTSIESTVGRLTSPVKMTSLYISSSNAFLITRIVTPDISNNTFAFDSATRCQVSSMNIATNNDYGIPVAIYGII